MDSKIRKLDTTEKLNDKDDDIKSLLEKMHHKVFIGQSENECFYQIRLFNIISGKKYTLNDISECTIKNEDMTAI